MRSRCFINHLISGPQGYEEAVSLANWDVFWYTRGFASMDTERSRRHASKLLTFPITIGGTIHQHSGLTLSNQRLTPEGSRSLAGKPIFSVSFPVAVLSAFFASITKYASCSSRSSRNRRSDSGETTSPNIYPWRPSRVLPPSTCLGATLYAFPIHPLSLILYRTPSFPSKTPGREEDCDE